MCTFQLLAKLNASSSEIGLTKKSLKMCHWLSAVIALSTMVGVSLAIERNILDDKPFTSETKCAGSSSACI